MVTFALIMMFLSMFLAVYNKLLKIECESLNKEVINLQAENKDLARLVELYGLEKDKEEYK